MSCCPWICPRPCSAGRDEPISSGDRRVTAAEGALTEPPGPTAWAAPQLTKRPADSEHRSRLGPEPGRPAYARRSARRRCPAVPQRRPQRISRGYHRPAASPPRRPRHPPSLPAVTANSFVLDGDPQYTHRTIMTHRTVPGHNRARPFGAGPARTRSRAGLAHSLSSGRPLA
jgi:hypothetical protein